MLRRALLRSYYLLRAGLAWLGRPYVHVCPLEDPECGGDTDAICTECAWWQANTP